MTSMTQDELARSVAAEFGGEVAAETDRQLRGDGSRAFGMTEAMALAALIAQCAQLALAIRQTMRDRQTLTAELEAKAMQHEKLPEVDYIPLWWDGIGSWQHQPLNEKGGGTFPK